MSQCHQDAFFGEITSDLGTADLHQIFKIDVVLVVEIGNQNRYFVSV